MGKQADGEGMAFDLGLRDGSLTARKTKGLTRGTHIEAELDTFSKLNFI
jgi:hypothetical protein